MLSLFGAVAILREFCFGQLRIEWQKGHTAHVRKPPLAKQGTISLTNSVPHAIFSTQPQLKTILFILDDLEAEEQQQSCFTFRKLQTKGENRNGCSNLGWLGCSIYFPVDFGKKDKLVKKAISRRFWLICWQKVNISLCFSLCVCFFSGLATFLLSHSKCFPTQFCQSSVSPQSMLFGSNRFLFSETSVFFPEIWKKHRPR